MKKILIIQNKRIGDVLIASIIPNNLKQIYPNSHITFFCYPYAAPVLWYNPNIDRVVTVKNKELKNLKNLFKIALQFRKEKFDIVVDPYVKIQSQFISLLSKAKMRVAFKKKVLPFAYTHQIPILEERNSTYGKAIDDRLNLLRSFSTKVSLDPFPKLFVLNEEVIKGKKLLQQYNIPSNKPVVMIGVLGSNASKSLPLPYIVSIVDYMTAYPVSILFNYIPSQKSKVDKIYQSLQRKENVHIDLIGKDIREFIVIMNQCSLLVANEGGTVHIAKALSKPTFTIYSPYVERTTWATFEDKEEHTSIHLKDFKPELFIDKSEKNARKLSSHLYKELSPELILPALKAFLKKQFPEQSDNS
ncbi:glycosyltransferase family 9 protein [Aquimarina sp. ERC-38]|uniref:glycosyltransferase family 9 protein n=1 Tax=Aquimarina sp. ERC-38 TaxID=2949996 RepID=UPI0022479CC6|nr:glycosyltransferase family 9 protein [Aquimarina sp. ERC-38]UZO80484.1 glycosyltransferase family 9 protein [Aquimarina sp. ERC-38]